jgi:hypothetical protein
MLKVTFGKFRESEKALVDLFISVVIELFGLISLTLETYSNNDRTLHSTKHSFKNSKGKTLTLLLLIIVARARLIWCVFLLLLL